MKLLRIILPLLLLIFSVGCSSKKKLVEVQKPAITICGLQKDSLNKYFPVLDSADHQWIKIKGDLKAEFKGKAYEINIQLRAKPNERVWVSLSKASFPLMKILLTTDSVFAIDLFNKQYFKTDYIGLSKRIGVELNFILLQNVLLAQYLPLPNADFLWEDGANFAISNQNKNTINQASEKTDSTINVVWAQWIACQSKSMAKQYLYVPSTKEELWIKSANPDTSTYLSIPTQIEVTTLVDKNKKVFIALDYKRFKQAPTMNAPFEIPDNYAKME
jgi:hypothetical protein